MLIFQELTGKGSQKYIATFNRENGFVGFFFHALQILVMWINESGYLNFIIVGRYLLLFALWIWMDCFLSHLSSMVVSEATSNNSDLLIVNEQFRTCYYHTFRKPEFFIWKIVCRYSP